MPWSEEALRQADDERASTHLRRLGINPITVARLREFAEMDGVSLREQVRYVLGEYSPPAELLAEWRGEKR